MRTNNEKLYYSNLRLWLGQRDAAATALSLRSRAAGPQHLESGRGAARVAARTEPPAAAARAGARSGALRAQPQAARAADSQAGAEIHRIAERTLEKRTPHQGSRAGASGEHHGTLTIATTHTQARYALPDVIRRFAQRYPHVQLSLRQGTPADVSHLVASGAPTCRSPPSPSSRCRTSCSCRATSCTASC